MSYYYKVRNDLSVSSLTKIIDELRSITRCEITIYSKSGNDLRLNLSPAPTRGEMEEIRASMTEWPPHYLKTLEWES